MLLKSMYIHSLNSLNFNIIVVSQVFVFDVETAQENAKLVILERLDLQIFFAPSQPWRGRRIRKFPLRKFSGVLEKPLWIWILSCKCILSGLMLLFWVFYYFYDKCSNLPFFVWFQVFREPKKSSLCDKVLQDYSDTIKVQLLLVEACLSQ